MLPALDFKRVQIALIEDATQYSECRSICAAIPDHSRASRRLATSDSSNEQQNEKDYHHQPQASARVVAPAPAVRPRRQAAQTQQQKDYEKYDQHFGLPSMLHSTQRLSL